MGLNELKYIVCAICSYLLFNISIQMAVGEGGLLVLALANLIGAVSTAIWFRKELVGKQTELKVAACGSLGILLIVHGLMSGYTEMAPSFTIEAVYNGFAVSSWFIFVALNKAWPKKFNDQPSWFALGCHGMMLAMVATRFTFWGPEITLEASLHISEAIVGYLMFNISIKLSGGNRRTNVAMNLGGAALLTLLAFSPWSMSLTGNPRADDVLPAMLAGLAILGIVWSLGKCYEHFGKLRKASLVAPLVYDGIIIAGPVVMAWSSGEILHSTPTFLLAFGMLLVTALRWRTS